MVAKRNNFSVGVATLYLVSAIPFTAIAADHAYYDGLVKRTVTMDTDTWASVEKNSPNSPITVRAAQVNEKSVLQNQSTASGKREFKSLSGSPVFRPQGNGPAMALPGGVIVNAKSGDIQAAVKKLQARGLTVERQIGNSAALLVTSPEGMASLDLANSLHESGDFESASPNWWRERKKK